jgi:hypothetical protein
MITGAFRQVRSAHAGTRNYGNYSDLPEIHQEKMEGLPVTDSGLAPSKWGARKESQCVRGVMCFRILLYQIEWRVKFEQSCCGQGYKTRPD